MQNIAIVGHSILSAMGNSTIACFENVLGEKCSIKEHHDLSISKEPFFASRLLPEQLMMLQAHYGHGTQLLSPFEQMCIFVVAEALKQTGIDVTGDDVVLILSSTKGNIEWLGKQSDERIALYTSAQLIANHFQMRTKPVVVSNACISGSLALITGARYLDNGRYKRAIVVGCDRLSGFVFDGFKSFKALANGYCRPFDKDREGINLGEAAACIILSKEVNMDALETPLAFLSGGGLTNDANHLSGPSRTGAELSAAIDRALKEALVPASKIGMISAHGTATIFNDEMEAKALHLSGLGKVPLHSLKSYIGHTLGAAGIIESIIACEAMAEDLLPASLGYETLGVTESVAVVTHLKKEKTDYLLKTASGFGGCNAAVVWQKFVD